MCQKLERFLFSKRFLSNDLNIPRRLIFQVVANRLNSHLWLLRLAMSRTVCAVSEAKSRAPATGLVTVPTRPLPKPEKKPLTPPSVFIPSTVEVMMLVMPPMIPDGGKVSFKGHIKL